MKEYGSIGQRRYAGIFSEEFMRELQGKRGIEVFREMSENDDVCGAIIYVLETLIRQSSWSVQPGGSTAKDKECAEFVESCMNDMQDTWTDTISEILSFLVFGWSYHEIVYKRRVGSSRDPRQNSRYTDGLIGWQKLPIRAQETLYRWEYDDNDNLLGMTQLPPPRFVMATIPIEKALHFKTKSRKNNPEGRSILRTAYRDWYFKRRFQEIEGMGIERDLAGLPVLQPPEHIDIWNLDDPAMLTAFQRAETIVRNVRRDSTEGLVLPFGWTFTLAASGGKRQFDTNAIIERYDTRIAMTVMADFILLGHQQVGSFALSSDKTELFSMALGAYLDIICEVFNNQAIPRLIGMNAEHFNGITEYPTLIHGDVETPNLQELSAYIKELTGCGVILPDEGLEDYVREVANLPERMEAQQFDQDARRQQRQQAQANEGQEIDTEEIEDEEAKDEAEAQEARKALGRA
ncbi:MAG: hypothetical protein IJ089_07110 [Clostridia bacterium]|nr:hypothetical protein [Clostridia bacterium]